MCEVDRTGYVTVVTSDNGNVGVYLDSDSARIAIQDNPEVLAGHTQWWVQPLFVGDSPELRERTPISVRFGAYVVTDGTRPLDPSEFEAWRYADWTEELPATFVDASPTPVGAPQIYTVTVVGAPTPEVAARLIRDAALAPQAWFGLSDKEENDD